MHDGYTCYADVFVSFSGQRITININSNLGTYGFRVVADGHPVTYLKAMSMDDVFAQFGATLPLLSDAFKARFNEYIWSPVMETLD
jgi:hypothetical protein